MPADVKLDDTQHYLIYTITDPLGMDELMNAYAKEKELRDSVPYTVHSIVDMSTVRGIPRNWLTAKAGPGLTHPRSGAILLVGLSSALTILIRTIFRVARYERMEFFKTREEAEAYMIKLIAGVKDKEIAQEAITGSGRISSGTDKQA